MSRPMKSSGVEWIGEIPAGWDVARGKYLFIKKSHPIRDLDDILTCFRDGQATLRKNRRLDGFTVAVKELGYQGVRKGDLVIHAMDAFAGAIGISDSDGKCSPVYSICKARNTLQTYLPFYAYLLRDMAQNGYIQSVAKGIRERSTDFRFSEVEKAFFSLPPLDEQRRIAAYLDRQTSLIDRRVALIGKKRRLLAEARKAIIHEAVTKGLDKGVAIKDSGVEWIGEIPAGWGVQRVGDACCISAGHPFDSSKFGDTGFPLVRIRDLQDAPITVFYSGEWVESAAIDNGDLIVGMDGDFQAKIWNKGPALLNQRLAKVSIVKKTCDLRFIAYSVQFALNELNSFTQSTTVKHLSMSDIRKANIPAPGHEEQCRIAEYLDQTTAKIDKQIELLGKMEELLKEQRKAIIHEAVTGKIDLSSYEPSSEEVVVNQDDDSAIPDGMSEEMDGGEEWTIDAS